MGLYNFKAQFIHHITSGRKQHTIRPHRAHADKPGNTMHLYTGLRTRSARLVARVPCVKVEEISIGPYHGPSTRVWVNGYELTPDEREGLALADGFPGFGTMAAFWGQQDRLPFDGQLIHWNWNARAK